jgi:DNA-binding GntR family transcriptional regulator
MVMTKNKTSTVLNKKPASALAQEKLLRLFQNGAFKSGEALKESVLAQRLEVTRPAMREALNQAMGWGVVEYKPYCGYSVRKFSIYDLLECYEMREALEPIAAWRIAQTRPPAVLGMLENYIDRFEKALELKDYEAANQCDSKFHIGIIEHCGNKSFARMQGLANLTLSFYFSSEINQYRHLVKNHTTQFLNDNFTDQEYSDLNNKMTIEMHREMVNSLKSGNGEKAEELFREHAHIQVENLRNIIVFQGNNQNID